MIYSYLPVIGLLVVCLSENPNITTQQTQRHPTPVHSMALQKLEPQPQPVYAMGTNKIQWSADQKLSWFDFQGKPVETEAYDNIAALTYSSIIYRHSCIEGKLHYAIEAVFRKHDSWVRPENKTPYYLEHEQLHFDITELYTRKMRKELSKYDFSCTQEDYFLMIVKRYLKEWEEAERKYDFETHFSNKKDVQRHWYLKVRNELSRTKAYAHNEIY